MAARTIRLPCVLLLLACALAGRARADGFSDKPVFIDPALKGWVAPLQTILFQVGCGEFYCVSAIYLSKKELHVLGRSKATLRRAEPRKLQRFTDKLAEALSPVAADLGRRGVVNGLVFTVYSRHLKGNVLAVDIYDSCLPVKASGVSPPVPLCLVESRQEELSAP